MEPTCIFVCVFDTLKGNIIQWQFPSECNIEGVEFSALPSGGHRVKDDVILFQKSGLCGLAIFENRPDENSDVTRGARMISIGVLQKSWSGISRFAPILTNSLGLIFAGEVDRAYSLLIENYNIVETIVSSPSQGLRPLFPQYLDFNRFLEKYGVNIFAIWKHAVLKKRILIYGAPPVAELCADVHWAHFISAITTAPPTYPSVTDSYLKYHVTLSDMKDLQFTDSWIACTTEAVYERKTDMYSLFVDKDRVVHGVYVSRNSSQSSLFDVNDSDLTKVGDLSEILDSTEAEMFFPKLNASIYECLKSLERAGEDLQPRIHFKQMKLHHKYDQEFIREFCRVYDIKINWSSKKPPFKRSLKKNQVHAT